MSPRRLAWRYTLYNGNDHPLDLVFPTTQVYDLAIWKGDAMLARWSTGKEFAAVTSTTTVGMGETIELTGSWTLPAGLEPGTYRLEFILTSTTPEPTGTSTEFAVQPAVADSLQVRFTSDHLIYRVGTALRVQCVITNTSGRDVTLSLSHGTAVHVERCRVPRNDGVRLGRGPDVCRAAHDADYSRGREQSVRKFVADSARPRGQRLLPALHHPLGPAGQLDDAPRRPHRRHASSPSKLRC